MSKYCLNLICPPVVEEKMLDMLLDSDDNAIFTSVPVHSHGTAHGRLSTQEQVMGRSRSTRIQILLGEDAMARLLERIKNEFAGTGIRYWATPVACEGEIA